MGKSAGARQRIFGRVFNYDRGLKMRRSPKSQMRFWTPFLLQRRVEIKLTIHKVKQIQLLSIGLAFVGSHIIKELIWICLHMILFAEVKKNIL